jgi:phenylpropionate dioxygenase-like ring-hydroxylating dioxygenase large terminal subunit
MWRWLGYTDNKPTKGSKALPERSLPASWYRSSSLYDLERRAIFSRKWIQITHKIRFTTTGEYVSFDYAGFSFFLVLDQQRNINGFHNVCRHRAYPIVQQQCGKTSVLSCKYHGWSYGLKGNLAKAPRFDTVPSFDKTQHGLLPINVHIDKVGFVWVNLEAGTPSIPWSAEFDGVDEQERMTQFGYSSGYTYDHTWSMDLTSNWKTVIENYNECYHCPTSHPLIAGVSDLPKYRVDPVGSTLEHTIVNKSANTTAEDADEMKRTITFFMPCTSVTVTRNFFYIQRMIPTSAQTTRIENEVYRHERASDKAFNDTMDFYKQVLEEDKMLCEGAQKNLGAGVFKNGELHPDKEKGPLHFQAWVREEIMSWRGMEKKEGREIWPASPKVSGEIDTEKLREEESFCSELEKASCGAREELAW